MTKNPRQKVAVKEKAHISRLSSAFLPQIYHNLKMSAMCSSPASSLCTQD